MRDDHVPWTRTSVNPIIDPADFVAFYAEADIYLAEVRTWLLAVADDLGEESEHGGGPLLIRLVADQFAPLDVPGTIGA